MPRYCDSCTSAGYVTADCWRSNPDNLEYVVVRNGAGQYHHTGPHAEATALEQAHQIATAHLRYRALKEPPVRVRVEACFYDREGGRDRRGAYVHVGRDRHVTADGAVVEDRADHTPRGLVTKVTRHRVARNATSPHARCAESDRCVEPVPKKEKCK